MMASLASKLAGKAFLIVDMQTKKAIGSAPTMKAARNKVHKKDNEYGAYRYRAMTKADYEAMQARNTKTDAENKESFVSNLAKNREYD